MNVVSHENVTVLSNSTADARNGGGCASAVGSRQNGQDDKRADDAVGPDVFSPDRRLASILAQAGRHLALFTTPGSIHEIRILMRNRVVAVSQYIGDDEVDKAAQFVAETSDDDATLGEYLVINPLSDEFVRAQAEANWTLDKSAGDMDIGRREWLLIDIDAKRPHGLNATDAERAAALDMARTMRDFLRASGFAAPVFFASPNGGYLTYRIDLPNDDASRDLVRNLLIALAERFDSPEALIDRKVFNASRLMRIAGTMGRKGENLPDRPWRSCALIEAPDQVEVTPRSALEAVALVPSDTSSQSGVHDGQCHRKCYDSGSFSEQNRESRAAKYLARMNPAVSGQGGHDQTFKAACVLVRDFDLSPDTAFKLLKMFNQRCVPPWSDHELRHKLGDADDFAGPRGRFLLKFNDTDLGRAQRFAAEHGEHIRYSHEWKRWIVWDGRRWAHDVTGEVFRLAKETARSITNSTRSRRAKAGVAQTMKRAESANGIQAMLALAQSESGIPVRVGDLDADAWLLNCANGTLDLHTGQLRPHRPADLITKLSPVAYDPDARCPVWEHALAAIFPAESGDAGDEELIGFLRRLLGYCLTGDVGEQKLPIFWGRGANGKTTIVETVLSLFGPDFAIKAPQDLLVVKKNDAHPTERADLFGKRLVACSETGEEQRLNEPLVKDLTGGERIRARRMREDFWEFAPTHKMILSTNYRPSISGTDQGIWRRVLMVPFTQTFWNPDDPADAAKGLPDRLRQDKRLAERLRAELPGILAWCVRGCLDWQRDGLMIPKKVEVATADYRREEDIVGEFLAAKCQRHPDDGPMVKSSHLFQVFTSWCAENGIDPDEKRIGQKKFSQCMDVAGIRSKKISCKFFLGISVIDTRDPALE